MERNRLVKACTEKGRIKLRCWHKDLIPVLPRQQLLGQWRECCLIAKNIAEKGTPNHILVNRIMDYPTGDFWRYSYEVYSELLNRGYKSDFKNFSDKFESNFKANYAIELPIHEDLFIGWHNNRYLQQCYYNLQEKYDCGGIADEEFNKIHKRFIEVYYK